MKKKMLSYALRAFVSIALIIILLYIMRDKYPQILRAIKNANLLLMVAAILAFVVAILTASLRLKLIVEAQEDIPLTFKEAVSLTFIGYFFNNFLPTSIGGDLVKAYYLSTKTSDKAGSFASIFIDRFLGLVTMIFMAFIALFFAGNNIVDRTAQKMIYAITVIAVIGIIFITNKAFAKKFSVFLYFFRPIEEQLKKAYRGINKYRHHKMLMVKSVIISLISQLLFFVTIGVLALSIGSRIPAMDILLRMPIISMMSLLPSINGLGLREGSTVLLFGPLIGKGNAFAVSILWLFVLLVISVAGGIIYALSPQFKVKFKEIEEEDAL